MFSFRRTNLFILASFFVLCCYAGSPSALQNVEIQNRNIEVTERGTLLFNASFKTLKPDWSSFENYAGKLKLSFKSMYGTPALVLQNKAQKKEDTAWKLVTKKITLAGEGNILVLDIGCCASTSSNQELSGNYSSRIFWYETDGKELFSIPFCFNGKRESFFMTRKKFNIPEKAVSFAVCLAADRPNIEEKDFFALNCLRAVRKGTGKNFEETASFISPILSADEVNGSVGNKVSWDGFFPEKAENTLQISVGTLNKNILKWTPFTGPDGKVGSYYKNGDTLSAKHASARFLRYCLTLKGHGKKLSVHEVRIGSMIDRNWKTEETYPPFVRNLTEPGENLSKSIRLRIESSVPLLWETLQFTIDGRYLTGRVIRKGNVITYTPDKPFYKTLHVIRVSIRDVLGRRTSVNRYFDFVPLPKKNFCTLRDDGIMLIDGKPFFPLCLTSMMKAPCNNYSYDEGFRQLKEAGFNLSHTYQCLRNDQFYNEFLPAAEKHGIRIFISGPLRQNSTEVLPLVNNIREERGMQSILFWYIGDDTHLHMTAEQTAEIADAVWTSDPGRLVAQSDVIEGLKGYEKCSDIFKMQVYPVHKKGVSEECVAAVIHDMKSVYAILENSNTSLSIWPTLQYFKGWKEWERYPTPTELRAMTYAALIHGACALSWYTYCATDYKKNFGAASAPENWKIMTALVRELKVLYPVLYARKVKEQPTIKVISGPVTDVLGYDSVTGLLKKHDGKHYLLTVNSSMKPVKAAIRLPEIKGGKVLFENRNITVKDGILTDDFAPFAVHVYELK